ncbi:MAG: class I SAM-dependent methyltransferase [Candidatus Berkiella sp.]
MSESAGLAKAYQQFSVGQFQKGMKLISLVSPQPGERVLDLGCGTGELTYQIANLVTQQGKVVAVDPDFERITLAQKDVPSNIRNITWFNVSAENYVPAKDETFDIVFSNFVLHWIPNPQAILNKLAMALRPNGRLAIQLVFDHPDFVKEVTLASQVTEEKVLKRYQLFPKDQWEAMVKKSGLTIDSISAADDYFFENLNAFFDWWEATTHGTFSRQGIPQQIKQSYEKEYEQGLHLYGKETLVLVASKR